MQRTEWAEKYKFSVVDRLAAPTTSMSMRAPRGVASPSASLLRPGDGGPDEFVDVVEAEFVLDPRVVSLDGLD